ncbi:MAG: hypothetical protein GXX11_00380 [Acholeplasmataceae bacterium]|jgi:Uncharacterized protein conserved in bacteria|nr:hypothetical protein [Acholeplasmataceae bacterium]
MVRQRKGICDQIKTLQSNLKNAEESFKAHNGARGELDLMLAEAQMQFLREKRGSKSFWARQTLAIGIAGILVLVGVGSWFWAKSTMNQSELAATQVKPVINVVQITQPQPLISPKSAEVVATNVDAMPKNGSGAEYKIKEPESLSEEQNVSKTKVTQNTPLAETQEMRNLVRVARKRLSESN